MKRSAAVWGLVFLCGAATATPVVYWASDPVGPDDTVMVSGGEFGHAPRVELVPLPAAKTWQADPWPADATAVEVLQPSEESVKFIIPKDWTPGAYAFRVVTEVGASAPVLLNAPTVYWAQGDQGTEASPGGWIRVFGRCMSVRQELQPKLTLVGDDGNARELAAAQATTWSARFELPDDFRPGKYRLAISNGTAPVEREAGEMTVSAPETWPQQVFNVRDFGATGAGTPTDDAAVRMALQKASESGGGVVYFPRGLYAFNGPVEIPRFTVLRGEATELVSLVWPDNDAPYTILQGTNHFGIEKLTVYCSNYVHVIAGELGKPDSGHCFLRGVRVRADMYRGHLTQEQVAARFATHMKNSTGGGDTVRLGGEDVEITDCDLYGSGRSLYLLRVRGGRVTGNTFYNGRWGWYCIDGPDRLIFEGNRIVGADLMSTGGSLNTYTSAYAQNVYYANNKLSLMHGWDREAMTSDAGGGAYFGTAEEVQPASLVLAGDPNWKTKQDWVGAGVFVLGGKGMGQYRRIASYDGRNVTLDRPWDILPDRASVITITMLQRQYLFVGNQFEDAGIALQYYGTSIDHVAADNTCARAGGFYNSGRWYRHFQPSWYCQFLGNQVLEGSGYRFGANNATSAGMSFIGTEGLQAQGGVSPLALCNVHRYNHLHNNAELRFRGVSAEHPGLKDVVAEHNIVENSDRGVFVDSGCVGVLLRENQFVNVVREHMNDREVREEAMKRRAGFLDRPDPVAYYTFDNPQGLIVPDDSGNRFWATATGRLRFVPGLVGQAPLFEGTSFLMVSDNAVLRFPRITLSAWVCPEVVEGRWGILAKRSRGAAAPYVLAIREGALTFEGTDDRGQWSYNFTSKPCLKAGQWAHVVAVCEEGKAVRLYCNGVLVGEKAVTQPLCDTDDVLTIGYENWGGRPAKPDQSGNLHGMVDEVKIWSRALTEEEIATEYARLKDAMAVANRALTERAAAKAELAQQFSGDQVRAGGLRWTLVKVDGFDGPGLSADWKTLRGAWTVEDGTLRCKKTSYLALVTPTPPPVRIEFDARSAHPGDLTAFVGTEKEAYLGGYFLGFASNNNTLNKILRLGEQVAQSDKPLAVPGKWHHVVGQLIGGKVQLFVDGALALEYEDPHPLPTANVAGLLAWSEGEFDNVRVYTGR